LKYRLARRTAWRALADETIVLDLETKRMYGFNESASFLWRTLEAMDDFEEMLRAMASETPPFGAEDLASFCDQLVGLELVEEAEPETRAPAAVEPLSNLEPPRILWQETLEIVAASCAFLPGQSPLCNQVPVS
jgi:hypothetical protein